MSRQRHRHNTLRSGNGGNNRGPAQASNGQDAFWRAGSKPSHTVFSSCVQADLLVAQAKRVEKLLSDLNYRCGRGYTDYSKVRKAQDEIFTAIAVFKSTLDKIQNGTFNKSPKAIPARPQKPVPAQKPQQPPQKLNKPATPVAAPAIKPGGNDAATSAATTVSAPTAPAVTAKVHVGAAAVAPTKPASEKAQAGNGAADKLTLDQATKDLKKLTETPETAAGTTAAGAKKPTTRIGRIVAGVRSGNTAS